MEDTTEWQPHPYAALIGRPVILGKRSSPRKSGKNEPKSEDKTVESTSNSTSSCSMEIVRRKRAPVKALLKAICKIENGLTPYGKRLIGELKTLNKFFRCRKIQHGLKQLGKLNNYETDALSMVLKTVVTSVPKVTAHLTPAEARSMQYFCDEAAAMRALIKKTRRTIKTCKLIIFEKPEILPQSLAKLSECLEEEMEQTRAIATLMEIEVSSPKLIMERCLAKLAQADGTSTMSVSGSVSGASLSASPDVRSASVSGANTPSYFASLVERYSPKEPLYSRMSISESSRSRSPTPYSIPIDGGHVHGAHVHGVSCHSHRTSPRNLPPRHGLPPRADRFQAGPQRAAAAPARRVSWKDRQVLTSPAVMEMPQKLSPEKLDSLLDPMSLSRTSEISDAQVEELRKTLLVGRDELRLLDSGYAF